MGGIDSWMMRIFKLISGLNLNDLDLFKGDLFKSKKRIECEQVLRDIKKWFKSVSTHGGMFAWFMSSHTYNNCVSFNSQSGNFIQLTRRGDMIGVKIGISTHRSIESHFESYKYYEVDPKFDEIKNIIKSWCNREKYKLVEFNNAFSQEKTECIKDLLTELGDCLLIESSILEKYFDHISIKISLLNVQISKLSLLDYSDFYKSLDHFARTSQSITGCVYDLSFYDLEVEVTLRVGEYTTLEEKNV